MRILTLIGLAISTFLTAYGGSIALKYPTTSNLSIAGLFLVVTLFMLYKLVKGKKKTQEKTQINGQSFTPAE